MTHIAGDRYILIERDDFQGPPTIANPPRQKKLHRDHHTALRTLKDLQVQPCRHANDVHGRHESHRSKGCR